MRTSTSLILGRFTSALVHTVVVLLPVLAVAALVVPAQGTSRGTDTQQKALVGSLDTLRQAIERYVDDHGGLAPDHRIIDQLTGTTLVDGTPGATCGPYLHLGVPTNPVNASNEVYLVTELPLVPDGTTGWVYCLANGEVRANVHGTGPAGTAYWLQ